MLNKKITHKKLLPSLVLGIALTSFSLVSLAAEKLTIQHASGTTQVAKNPKVVAVLDWSSLDTMEGLGIKAQGIPKTTILPKVVSSYADAKVTHIGTLFDPDFEAIKNLNPDLIILGRRAAGHYEEASKFAPTLNLTPNPSDLLNSVVKNTQILADIFDRQEAAEKLITQLKTTQTQLQELAKQQGAGLTLLTTGGKMAAFGVGTRFGLVHDVFGVKQAAPSLNVGRHGQGISYEFILENNPEWIFVMDRDAAIGRDGIAAKQMLANELVELTNAGQKQQIVYLDPQAWYLLDSSGARVLLSNMQQLIEVFSK